MQEILSANELMLDCLPCQPDVPAMPLLLAARVAPMVSGVVILAMCVVAGIGTVLLLPSRREASIRKIGGMILLAAVLIFAAVLTQASAVRTSGGVYFWVFSAIAILGSIRVISHPRPVYSAMYFVLTVLATAGLFVLMWAEFMAAALVLIYAGAILVTYIFVIMLATQASSGRTGEAGGADCDQTSREPVAAAAVGFTLMGVLLFVILNRASDIPRTNPSAGPATVQTLATYLFNDQVVSLELAGIILTLGMAGAVLIARRQTGGEDERASAASPDEVATPATPPSDDPHSIPVHGTRNPAAKSYPQQ